MKVQHDKGKKYTRQSLGKIPARKLLIKHASFGGFGAFWEDYTRELLNFAYTSGIYLIMHIQVGNFVSNQGKKNPAGPEKFS